MTYSERHRRSMTCVAEKGVDRGPSRQLRAETDLFGGTLGGNSSSALVHVDSNRCSTPATSANAIAGTDADERGAVERTTTSCARSR